MIGTSADSLIRHAQTKLTAIKAKGQTRSLKPSARSVSGGITRDQRHLISFSDNDYLGLSQDPRVKQAAIEATEHYGTGAGASRLITGDNILNGQLETALAEMKGTEAALVFGSGYLANISLIPTLVGKGDLVLLDERSHNCMFAGARLSGAEVKIFRHNDVAHAHMLLRESTSPRKLIMTETVFSMDGDTAPLLTLHELAEEYGAWFMTDDAHGLGVITESNPALIQMGTFSKAGGSYGGYICGPRPLIDLLINRGRGFIFTTGLPPGIVAASLKSLNIIKNEPQRQERLRRNVEYFCMELGLTVSPSAIVPLILGTEERALQASEQLFEKGFIVTAIRPPTVAPGTARLRFSFSSEHEFEDVQALVNAVRPIVSKKKVEAA